MEKYFNFKDKINVKELEEVANNIRNGGIAIFPTETVYGIGTNGLIEDSVKKIYEIKKRPITKPINLLVSNFGMIEMIAKDISDIEYKLMKKFFPGPFTIILNKNNIIPNIVTAGGTTVGVRMPEGEIARSLVELAGVPIATPSANISDKPSGISYESIIDDFHGKIDYFIDGGESKFGIASTIVKVEEGKPQILREGSISKEEIMKVLDL
jgi:L-threonylcarbamoyladenylate synthase